LAVTALEAGGAAAAEAFFAAGAFFGAGAAASVPLDAAELFSVVSFFAFAIEPISCRLNSDCSRRATLGNGEPGHSFPLHCPRA
jgi:hypothetical protein